MLVMFRKDVCSKVEKFIIEKHGYGVKPEHGAIQGNCKIIKPKLWQC